MKKGFKIALTVIFSILAFFCLLGVIGCIQDNNIPSAAVGVFFMALSVFLAILPHIIKKSQKPTATIQYQTPASVQNAAPRSVPLASPSVQTAPAVVHPSPSDDAREKRRLFIEKKKAEYSTALSEIPRVPISLSDVPASRAVLDDMPDFKSRNITRATRLETLFPLVVIDVETTGINLRGNEIIEVSAIKYENGFHPVSCFTTLIKPKKPIPPEASEVNHITDDMVAECPPFSAVAESFSDFISGCNVAGHNLIDFDLRFLFVQGVKLSEKVKYYDTLEIAKLTLTAEGKKKFDHHSGEYVEVEDWDIENYKLETLCDHYYIFRPDAHRSLSDCYATGLVLQHLIEDKTE